MTALALRRPLPTHVTVLVFAVVVTGFTAAKFVAPLLWWTTPLMASLVVYGWTRAPGVADPDADPAELPADVRRVVRDTFVTLAGSPTLDAIRSIVSPARTLFATAHASDALSPALLRDCAELVEVSCATALELARLEHLLAVEASSASHPRRRAVRDDLTQGSRLLRQRLEDAGAALTRLYVQCIEGGSTSSDRVAELARDLSAEVSRRRLANAEVEALLRS